MRTMTTAQEGSSEGPRSGEPERSPDGTLAGGASSRGPGKPRGRDPLLAAICHDLRAPLAAVTMGANFVLQTTPEDESSGRSRRVLQAILRSCKQMERLVRDFGDLSEIESDAVELRLGVHDANEIVAVSAETARTNAMARNVEVSVTIPEKPVPIHCDRERISRALAHVLDNAVKFSPEGGTVSVVLEETSDEVHISVTDRGPGLSAETLANLYDRSWHSKRADRTGAGLGLAIVCGFVRAHDGTVEVESKPGSPTKFTLKLPKEAPSITEAVKPPH
jgi:signal transduction histidine kinase